MDAVRFQRRPQLRDAALVAAFRGWNDGGEAATTAVAYMRDRWGAEPVGDVDPEGFLDFQVTRPTVRLVEGVTRRIDWPELRFYHAALPERDVVLFLGIEPNVRWRTFTETIVGAARDLGVRTTVTLGAFLADVPHTLIPPITGITADRGRVARLGLSPSRYEGPTGITGVLHDAFSRADMAAGSLWAAVPHYLPGGPNPRAAQVLVEKTAEFLEVDIDTETLARAGDTWESQVSSSIEENPELLAYVRQLEAAAEQREGFPEIPSGDTLAAELERFLREQRGES